MKMFEVAVAFRKSDQTSTIVEASNGHIFEQDYGRTSSVCEHFTFLLQMPDHDPALSTTGTRLIIVIVLAMSHYVIQYHQVKFNQHYEE